MFDYQSIKALAKSIRRRPNDLLALTLNNDPFSAGLGWRAEAAEWFGEIWKAHAGVGPHIRRIHYRLVSPPDGIRILLPNGREYQNTHDDWTYLARASLAARYLDLIPFDGLVDRRNDEPMFFAGEADPDFDRDVSCEVTSDDVYVSRPEFPDLPEIVIDGFETVQDFILETWIEKSTQNDWLVPL
jgi:hypothetical protein